MTTTMQAPRTECHVVKENYFLPGVGIILTLAMRTREQRTEQIVKDPSRQSRMGRRGKK